MTYEELMKQLACTFPLYNGNFKAENKTQYLELALLAVLQETNGKDLYGKPKAISATVIYQILENASKLFGETLAPFEKIVSNQPLYPHDN